MYSLCTLYLDIPHYNSEGYIGDSIPIYGNTV